ncbi:MAG: nucleotidyltransferase domain-containing protein [Candidatus Goldbacteria bacterium]|nr:nucleotidyltransferase domain-containing protein [Candidatus Goldiibacteriota bacterium]HPD18457.1 nucleotidyltransferase domain-containing protein [Candidatus Goldiibacteriota bacterium]
MNKMDIKIVNELKEKLENICEILDVKIFGSRVKGKADKYSDLDVFIEVKEMNYELKDKIYDAVWEVGFANSVFISPVIFTKYEIENTPLKHSPLLINIRKEGITI